MGNIVGVSEVFGPVSRYHKRFITAAHFLFRQSIPDETGPASCTSRLSPPSRCPSFAFARPLYQYWITIKFVSNPVSYILILFSLSLSLFFGIISFDESLAGLLIWASECEHVEHQIEKASISVELGGRDVAQP